MFLSVPAKNLFSDAIVAATAANDCDIGDGNCAKTGVESRSTKTAPKSKGRSYARPGPAAISHGHEPRHKARCVERSGWTLVPAVASLIARMTTMTNSDCRCVLVF